MKKLTEAELVLALEKAEKRIATLERENRRIRSELRKVLVELYEKVSNS